MKAKRMSRMAIWLVFLSVLSIFYIPIGDVPITLQVFALFLMSAFLSPLESVEVAIAYLVMGAIGVPIFAGFEGGLQVLVGPTGGYLMAFPIASFFSSLGWRKKGIPRFALLSLALITIYALGIVVLMCYIGNFSMALKTGFFPFVGIDILKILGVFAIVHKLKVFP